MTAPGHKLKLNPLAVDEVVTVCLLLADPGCEFVLLLLGGRGCITWLVWVSVAASVVSAGSSLAVLLVPVGGLFVVSVELAADCIGMSMLVESVDSCVCTGVTEVCWGS